MKAKASWLLSSICTVLMTVGLSTVSAHAVPTSITLNFTDRSGAAAPVPTGGGGTATCYANWVQLETLSFADQDSTISFNYDIDSSAQVECYVTPGQNFATDRSNYSFSASPGVPQIISVAIISKDATANVSLLDGGGQPFSLSNNLSGYIECRTTTEPTVWFSKSIEAEDSSVSLPLVSSWNYTCYASLSDSSIGVSYASSTTQSFTASVEAPSSLSVTVAPVDATVEINLFKPNNISFPTTSVESVSVTCHADSVGFSSTTVWFSNFSSTAPMTVPSGVPVTCTVTGRSGYETPASVTETLTSNETAELDFVYVPYSQQIQVNLTNGTGAFVLPEGKEISIYCYKYTSPSYGGSVAVPEGASTVQLALPPGTYSCSVNSSADLLVAPSYSTVTVAAGATATYNASVVHLDATLTVELVDTAGEPLTLPSSGSTVSCQSSGGHQRDIQISDSNQGSRPVLSGVSYACIAPNVDGYTVPAPQTVTISSGKTQTLTFSYTPLNQSLTVSLVDQNNHPIPSPDSSASVNCYLSGSGMTYYWKQFVAGSSSRTFKIAPGSYTCGISNVTGYVVLASKNVTIVDSVDKTLSFTLYPLDATVTAKLVHPDGSSLSLPSPGNYVNCQTSAGGSRSIYISESNQGSTSVQSGVLYTCSAPNIEGYTVPASQTATVSSGGTATLTFTYTPLAQNLTVNLQDKNGDPIAVPDSWAWVNCYRPGSGMTSYSKQFVAGSSSRTFAIEPGTYTCSLSNVTGYTALSSKNVTVTNSVDASITFTLFSVDSSLQVNLKDSAGNPVAPFGWANVGCSASGDGYYFSFSGSFSIGESSTVVNVIGGYSYSCYVSSFGNYSGANFSVSVPLGGEMEKDVILLEKNATLRVSVINKGDGQPVLIPQGGGSVYVSCYSNSGSGYASAQINEGESTALMLTVPGTYSCWANIPGYNVPYSNKTVRTIANETVEYTIEAERKDSTIILNFKDQDGNILAVPANSQWPNASCWSNDGGSYATLNQGETSKEIQVVGGSKYYCSVYGLQGYAGGSVSIDVGVDTSQGVDVKLQALDGTLTLNLVTGANSTTPYVVPDGTSAWTYCHSEDFSNYGNIESGGSSISFKVLGGKVYNCSVWLPGLATSPAAVEVAHNGNSDVSIPVLNPDVVATVRLVDAAGSVVTNAENVSVGAYSSNDTFNHDTSAPFTNGVAILNLVANGSYSLYPYSTSYMQSIYGLIKAGESYYLHSGSNEEILAPGSGSVTKDILIKLADATLQVSSGGVSGWVNVEPVSDDSSQEFAGISGEMRSGGLTIPVPGGTYKVSFWPETSEALVPKPQKVVISAGNTKSVAFEIISQDHLVNITASAGAGVYGYFWCNALTASGITSNGSGASFGETTSIGISSSTAKWSVNCQGYSDDNDLRYEGEGTYTVTQGTSSGSLTIALVVAGALIKGTTTASSDAEISVTAGGDKKLTAGQGTFSSGQTVTVEVNNSGKAPRTEEVIPETVYEFKATNNNHDPLTAEKDVIFELPLEPDQEVYTHTPSGGYKRARKTEVTESNKLLASFSLGVAAISVKSTTLVKITVPKEAFNSGVLVIAKSKGDGGASPPQTPIASPTQPTPALQPPADAPLPGKPAESAPAAPQGFKLTKAKTAGKAKASFTASWLATSGASSYEVTIMLGKKLVKKLTVKALPKPSVKLPSLKKGKYIVTLRATNAAGGSPPVSRKLTV